MQMLTSVRSSGQKYIGSSYESQVDAKKVTGIYYRNAISYYYNDNNDDDDDDDDGDNGGAKVTHLQQITELRRNQRGEIKCQHVLQAHNAAASFHVWSHRTHPNQ